MKNQEIADIFHHMGTLLEMKGENVFKIRAYYKASENIANLVENIDVLKKEGRLSQIPGIGEALREKIIEYCDSGKVLAYEQLTKEIPESLLEVMAVPSVGPKKTKLFYDHLGIKDVEGLKMAAREGKLLTLPGIKEKTVENILRGLKVVEEGRQRMNLGTASKIAEEFVSILKKLPVVKKISVAGSLRRGSETVRDIDILVDAAHPGEVMEIFVHLPQVKTINAHGETKSSILTKDNVQVDLRVVESKSFGAALLYFTGSKSFNIRLRQIAMKKDMKVNEYGIFLVKDGKDKCLASRTEEECFHALGLPLVSPELREELGEEELFSSFKIPDLIELKDLRGEFHVHSTWSDGRHTIEQMVVEAKRRGYEYLAISDHSPRLRIAGGVLVENLKKKKREIEQLNERLGNFRVLFGTEVEIDMEGNLDYNNQLLSEFDIVIAAIHSGFEQGREQLTRRLIKACQNKYVHIIAHPTGVHLGKRAPYDIDFKEFCKAAVDNRVFLEINSFPIRLDLNSQNVYFARRQGVKFVINSDSHAIEHLNYVQFGIKIARRGWLTKENVLNTLPLPNVLKEIKK